MSSASELVLLRGGPPVPVAALQLLWALEARGFHVRLDEGVLCVAPGPSLTPADRDAIQQHREALIAVVTYTGCAQ